MSKKKSILRLLIPTAICSFMFVPLMSGVLSHSVSSEVHATEYEQILFEGHSEFVQIDKDKLPEENPDQIIVEFDGSFDNLIIANSGGDELATILSSDCGKKHFDDSQWELIKNADEVWVNTEAGVPIVKITYLPKGILHTHGEGAGAYDFYNWDGGAGHNLMPTEEGSYCLTSDIELQSGWAPSGITNLCLNGHNIKITIPGDHVISIAVGATLNLYDCDTHYQFFEDIDGLWSLKAEQDVPTDYAINGGCIMGATVGGVYCSGTFNMYGGNIVGNKATNGGGVNNVGTFNMYGGNISGNLATDSGGGLYTASNAVSILTGGTITQNTATNDGSGVYYQNEACFVAGTQITMADGSKKAIEDLAVGDSVRVFDHNNGYISSSNLFDVGAMFEQHSGVVNLHFTSDIDLSVVYGHSFFERETNKYVPVTKDTVSNYVGHEFYNADNACWETLTGYDFVDGEVDTYIIASEYNLNCVANGMLSVEDGFYTALSNTFEFGDNLTIDAIKKAQDIEKYGIYDFENINYVNKHTYDALGLENLNVTVGKGLFCKDYFEYLAMVLSEVDPEIYCDIEESEPVSKSMPRRTTRTETPVSAPTAAGLYVGGSIQIIGNEEQNLYLPSGAMVTIGTGTVGDGNGVPTPTEEMSIGLTLGSGIGAFTASGVEDYSANFFSDNENYAVRLNKGTEETPGDYLSLETLLTITNNNPKTSKDTYNGYIELPASAVAGDEVSVTVFPNQGYKLASLKYNDGEKDHDIEDLSFVMPEGEVSVFATFGEKALQEIKFSDLGKVFDNSPIYIAEKNQWSTSNYFERLGDGDVIVEFKEAGADDETYTTSAPKVPGNYTVRVSVAESANYLAGSATKDFTIEHAKIAKVGFGDIAQPIAGGTAQTTVTGIAIGAKYSGTLTWSTAIPADGKYACNTTYTATVALNIVPSAANNYEFADDVVVVKPVLDDDGWALSDDSTSTQLIFTKTFETTADHSVGKVSGTVTCTTAGYKDAYLCEYCGLYFEDQACTKKIGDASAYALWKEGDGKSSALGHHTTKVNGQDPTCTQDGFKDAYYCDDCGMYFEDASGTTLIGNSDAYNSWKSNGGKISASGHDTTKVNGQDPTCTQDGYKDAYLCENCGLYFEDEACTKKIGDASAYDLWKEGDGKSSALGHNYSGEVTYTWNDETHECTASWHCDHTGCDEVEFETVTGAYVKDTDATCETNEKGHYEATFANSNFKTQTTTTNSVEIENTALGHHTTKVNGQDPTCTEDGYKFAYYCDDCGMYFENADGTGLIGDSTAYNAWKANAGHLDKLVKEAEEPAKDNTGLIVGLAVGGFLLLLLIIYLLGYFFLYRKGKLDERKIKVIYKILPRGDKNLKE